MPQPPRWFATSVQLCGIYPFGAGTGRPINGAPLGQDMNTHSAVCTDHDALYRANVISSPVCVPVRPERAREVLHRADPHRRPGRPRPHAGDLRPDQGRARAVDRGARRNRVLHRPARPPPAEPALARPPRLRGAPDRGDRSGASCSQLARAKSIDLVKLVVKISRGTHGAGCSIIEETALEAIVDTILDTSDRTTSRSRRT